MDGHRQFVFMPLGMHRVEGKDGVLVVGYGRLETIFLIGLTLLLGPFLLAPFVGAAFPMGRWSLDGAPFWVPFVALAVPLAATGWLVHTVYIRILNPTRCILDGPRRQVILLSSGGPDRIDGDQILDCEIARERDADAAFYTFRLHLKNGDAVQLFSLQSERKRRRIAEYLADWLTVRAVNREGC